MSELASQSVSELSKPMEPMPVHQFSYAKESSASKSHEKHRPVVRKAGGMGYRG